MFLLWFNIYAPEMEMRNYWFLGFTSNVSKYVHNVLDHKTPVDLNYGYDAFYGSQVMPMFTLG